MARYEGQCSGPIVLMGQGAGRYPTASAVVRDLTCILLGHREMLPENCWAVKADNSQVKHLYYVKTSEDMLHMFPSDLVDADNGIARIITKEMSVEKMHSLAKDIREKGGKIFFAAIGG